MKKMVDTDKLRINASNDFYNALIKSEIESYESVCYSFIGMMWSIEKIEEMGDE